MDTSYIFKPQHSLLGTSKSSKIQNNNLFSLRLWQRSNLSGLLFHPREKFLDQLHLLEELQKRAQPQNPFAMFHRVQTVLVQPSIPWQLCHERTPPPWWAGLSQLHPLMKPLYRLLSIEVRAFNNRPQFHHPMDQLRAQALWWGNWAQTRNNSTPTEAFKSSLNSLNINNSHPNRHTIPWVK